MKNKTLVSSICIALLLAPLPFASYAETNDISPAKKYIDEVTSSIPTLTAQELRIKLESVNDKTVLLDVRTFYERKQTKTILGDKEIHIPRGFLETKAWKGVPKDKTVVVYCSKGIRSKLAVKTLQDMGWKNTIALKGGVQDWYQSINEPCGCLPDAKEVPDKKEVIPEAHKNKPIEGGCKP
ncbi:putative sulfur carrier protein YrkF [Nymphon striatum]|nr:putative sulfur carrier protein YrkF [Nymphon striatum]